MKVKTLHLQTAKIKISNFLPCLLKPPNNFSIFPSLPQQGKNREVKQFSTSSHSSSTFPFLPYSDFTRGRSTLLLSPAHALFREHLPPLSGTYLQTHGKNVTLHSKPFTIPFEILSLALNKELGFILLH